MVTVTLYATVRGHTLLFKYEKLVGKLYAETKEEEEMIVGTYVAKVPLHQLVKVSNRTTT